MRRLYLTIVLLSFLLYSCAAVLSKDMLIQGTIGEDLSDLKNDPASNKGRLFIFGGIIVKTSATRDGSLIEAIFVPVNSRGYLKGHRESNGRFLALYKSNELLDPLIYKENREITLAGEFIEMRKGQIEEMEYSYPFFEIKEIYLWEEIKERDYYYYYFPPPYYPPWYFRHRIYDPWWHYY